jgi:Primase C terminal 2 (PriCT-2)
MTRFDKAKRRRAQEQLRIARCNRLPPEVCHLLADREGAIEVLEGAPVIRMLVAAGCFATGEALDQVLSGALDRKAWAFSQAFYLPSCPVQNQSDAFFVRNQGAPLPVDEFVGRGQAILVMRGATKMGGGGAHSKAVGPTNNTDNTPPVNRINTAIVQSMLDALPDECASDFGHWLRVGFALHYFDEGKIGLAMWERFSGRYPEKAKVTDFAARWVDLNRDYKGKKVSIGWLWAEARSHGWRAPCRWDRSTHGKT